MARAICMTGPLTVVSHAKPKTDDPAGAYAKILEAVRQEPGTLTYRMFQGDDGRLTFYDDYESSEALLAHVHNLTQAGLMEVATSAYEFEGPVILGTPSPEARAVLEQMGAVIREHVDGFSRLGRMEPAPA